MFSYIQRDVFHPHFTFKTHPCPTDVSQILHIFILNFWSTIEKCSHLEFFSKFHSHNYPTIWPPPHPHPLFFFIYLAAFFKTSTCLLTDTSFHDWSMQWGRPLIIYYQCTLYSIPIEKLSTQSYSVWFRINRNIVNAIWFRFTLPNFPSVSSQDSFLYSLCCHQPVW